MFQVLLRYLVLKVILDKEPLGFDENKASTKTHYERLRPKLTQQSVKQKPNFHRLHSISKSRHVPVGDEPLY